METRFKSCTTSDLARALLEKKVVQLSPDAPFTWKSGYNMPMYCDNRGNLSHVDNREIILSMLFAMAGKHQFNAILAVPSAGVPWGALLAQQCQVPLLVPIDGGYLCFDLDASYGKYDIRYDAHVASYPSAVPYGICFAYENKLPFAYLRSKPKAHGVGKQLEGDIAPGSSVFVNFLSDDIALETIQEVVSANELRLFSHGSYLPSPPASMYFEISKHDLKVLVVEDLVSTGGSTNEVINQARQAGITVEQGLCIMDYGFPVARQAFERNDVQMTSLVTYADILACAKEIEYVTQEQAAMLADWSSDPFGWGAKNGFPKVEN